VSPLDGPFPIRGEELTLGGIGAREIARRFGTPVYVYDAGVVADRYARLRRAMPERVDISYALKANPSLAVCALLARLGAGADAASRGELLLARAAGFEAGSVLMAGPAKSPEDHRLALEMGIRALHVESESELIRLDELAREADRGSQTVPVGLRVNTTAAIEEERSIIGGAGPRKFGIDEEQLHSALQRVARCGSLRMVGLHVFNASNVRSADRLVENASGILELAAKIASDLAAPLGYVDIGGGLGVPYRPGEDPLDVEVFGRGLGELLAGAEGGPLSETRLIVEPGRYLVCEAGIYLCRVLEVKVSRGRNFVMVDGGIHHLLRPVLLADPHTMVLANRVRTMPEDIFDVAGPLCTGLDVLGKDVALPQPAPGDLIAVMCAGAYGYTESMTGFLSHPAPPEVVVRDGEAGVVRDRVEPEEGLSRQRVPDFLLRE
jgi:diaminopimelate decarboxylase